MAEVLVWLKENEIWFNLIELVVMLTTFFLVVWTYRRARSAWSKRDFTSRVNVSLNYVEGNTLKLRTLREADIDEILLNNPHGKSVVLNHAKHKTSLEKPFLELPEEDRWLVLNSILNELSEQFAVGLLAASMGAPVKTARYVFGLTCERDKRVRLNKIRVMVIEKSLLQQIDTFEELQFEQPSHSVRLETLKRMKELYEDPQGKANLFEVELAMVDR